jgi:thymidylate synthase (FAD)
LVAIENIPSTEFAMRKMELYTRLCYKSEGKVKGTVESAIEFVKRIFQANKHRGIIEHMFVTVRFITDRGITHEIVRHRLASYLQESTRYCNYSGKGIGFILPPWISLSDSPCSKWDKYIRRCRNSVANYLEATDEREPPEEARYWLASGIKTEIIMTANLRSWHNYLTLRCHKSAHPQMRQLAIPLLTYFKGHFPGIFDDIETPVVDFELAEVVENFGFKAIEPNYIFEE